MDATQIGKRYVITGLAFFPLGALRREAALRTLNGFIIRACERWDGCLPS